MKVPGPIVQLTAVLSENQIDYRIVGGQAAVLYGLREESEDWDFAVAAIDDKLKQVMAKLGYTEIPDSQGLSWEQEDNLVDFIVADGDEYPTLSELGLRLVNGLRFVSRSMMGYINWKDGKSAYQELEKYKEDLANTDIPKAVTDEFDVDWIKQSALITTNVIGDTVMLDRLVKLANSMDESGHASYADMLDDVVAQLVAPPVAAQPQTAPMPAAAPSLSTNTLAPAPKEFSFEFDPKHKDRATGMRATRIFDAVMEKIAGLQISMIRYYLDIAPEIEKLQEAVTHAETLQAGSQAQIELKRKIHDSYNNVFDPYNTADPIAKIGYISELAKIAKLVTQYLPQFDKPEFGEDQIIENFVKALKEKNYLVTLNKLKKSVG